MYFDQVCSFAKPIEYKRYYKTRSSESDGRSDVTDSFECPDKFRVS